MSVWTHVAAVFRIDGLKVGMDGPRINGYVTPDWDEVTKKAIYECDWLTEDSYEQRRMRDDWNEYREHPERFMPTGSEGSLQRLVWVNPDKHSMPRWVVTVFGDLRDYDDPEAIHKWFDEVCSRCYIRQAVCHCDVSGPTYTWEHKWE